jgi:signal transduction histidine kinase/ligand-binding sensor domain-containing protein
MSLWHLIKSREGMAMLRIWAFSLGLLLCGAALAIPLDRKIFQLQHQTWTAKDGAPASIATIDQTDDGYLWLGTDAGLYRFDGAHFELYEPRQGKISQGLVYFIKAQPGVGLWVGWGIAGISLIRDGVITNYGVNDGVPEGSWWGFDFDPQGGVWAAGVRGLLHFDGKKWRQIGEQDGFTARKASAIFIDQQGTVGAFSEQGLFLKAAGSRVFAKPLGHTDVRQPPQLGADGRIYFLEESSIRIIDGLARYEQPDHAPIFKGPRGEAQSMLIDRSGSFWYSTHSGLRRTDPDHPDSPEPFDKKDGLTADIINCFFEDREGNIWLATRDGLDRFRQTDVNKVKPSLDSYQIDQVKLLAGSGTAMTMASSKFGGGWIAMEPDGAVQNTDWLKRHQALPTQSLTRGRDGTVLVAAADALYRIAANNSEERIAWPADMGPVHRVYTIAQDGDGAPWIAVVGNGVFQYKDGRWQRNAGLPKEGKQTPMCILADSHGRLWFGYSDNTIALLEDGKISLLTTAQGLDLGRVSVIHEADGQVIAGGERGLAVYRNQRFEAWKINAKLLINVAAIVHSSAGDLWINSTAGTVRIRSALASWRQGLPIAPSQIRVLDGVDGRVGVASLLGRFSLAEAGDGRIWIADNGGVSWIDPQQVLKVPMPPPVTIESLTAGNQYFRLPLDTTLAPNSRDIQLNYSSPVLGTPERMRFKYRLDGYDTEWHEAGARRQAFYTGVSPGRYHFRVIASNGGERWTEEGPGLHFTVTPAYYQTIWFKALLLGLAACLLWLAFQLRLRHNAKTFKAQLEARHGERERIARELHDTLLQGMHALILDVDNAANRLSLDEPGRKRFDHLLEQAEAVLAEGREQVLDLRGTDFHGSGTFALIQRDGASLIKETGLQFVCRELGKKRDLQPASGHEMYRIAMESIINTVKHAHAKNLAVTVRYTYFALHLEISDDGIGIPPEALAQGGTPGHFGLPGLYERAARLHADLHIASKHAFGTVVRLRVPAQLAYVRKSWLPSFLRRH